MLPQITTPKSFVRALNYNEKKVQQGKAELIHAGNFLKNPKELSFSDKKERFESLMERNERAQTKTIHISLNFHPSEKERLTKELLIELTDKYMQRIGFGNQPYLVYQHHDAAHPHVHIVSTLIQEDGKRIPTHNIGRDVSEPARKALEQEYNLVSANKKAYELESEKAQVVNARKVEYGQSETRRSITNVLDAVLDHYKYTSLAEFNAVLRQYNVLADRGKEDSRTYQHRGLHYRILDEQGNKTGVPIKASSIYSKPTLERLEQKMEANKEKREPDKKRLKTAIDWSMQRQPENLQELAKELERERVALIVRRNAEGRVYGITYIDHERKSVFNGSDLGKEYSANRILERLGREQQVPASKEQMLHRPGNKQPIVKQPEISRNSSGQQPDGQSMKGNSQRAAESAKESIKGMETGQGLGRLIEQWLEPEGEDASINKELTEEERRKRRRQQDLER